MVISRLGDNSIETFRDEESQREKGTEEKKLKRA